MKTNELNDLTKTQRARFFATAPRASAGTMCKLLKTADGNTFVRYWCPRLRGRFVKLDKFYHESRAAAVDEARRFRERARQAVEEQGAT